MSFGIDVIAEKAGIISTIQVKRTQSQAINASNEKRYNRIDLFFYSDNGTTGYI
jgi:Holliday junction resolvase-like predicted endonuclease